MKRAMPHPIWDRRICKRHIHNSNERGVKLERHWDYRELDREDFNSEIDERGRVYFKENERKRENKRYHDKTGGLWYGESQGFGVKKIATVIE